MASERAVFGRGDDERNPAALVSLQPSEVVAALAEEKSPGVGPSVRRIGAPGGRSGGARPARSVAGAGGDPFDEEVAQEGDASRWIARGQDDPESAAAQLVGREHP